MTEERRNQLERAQWCTTKALDAMEGYLGDVREDWPEGYEHEARRITFAICDLRAKLSRELEG